MCIALPRHNQELEQDAVVTHEEKRQLQLEAHSLAERLEAVMHDKFVPRAGFDADTPIDKTLDFLQSLIGASHPLTLMHILATQLQRRSHLQSRVLYRASLLWGLLWNTWGSLIGRQMHHVAAIAGGHQVFT